MALDKDEELKKQVRERVQAEVTEEYRKKLTMERESDFARQMEEIKKDRIHVDPETGHEVDRWEEVIRKSNKMINDSAMSYVDWRASMSSLISLFTNLNQALAQSKGELLSFIGLNALNLAKTYAYDPLKEKISGSPEVVLPTLQYLAEYSDDNKLKIHSLKRFDGDDLGEAINQTFQAGVHKWLDDMNYKPSATEPGKWVEKDTGAVLTKDQFNALKDDPNRGLAAVLSDHFDMELEERPRPSGP